jgi:hypothetical protein
MPAQRLVFSTLSLILGALILLSSITPALAVTTINQVGGQPIQGKPLTKEGYNYLTGAQTTIEGGIFHTILCSLVMSSLFGDCHGYFYNGNTGKAESRIYDQSPNGGAIGFLGSTAMALYTPPTSATLYLAEIGENIGLSPRSAYAQVAGSGEGIIHPVLQLWQAVRNLAYLAFILVFLAVGFMIMFRSKINPQTVISVQAALPSLVVGLILITFSYFIAALIVDLSFVGVQLSAQVFKSTELDNRIGNIDDLAQNSNIFQMFLNAGFNNIGTIFSSTQTQFKGTLDSLAPGGSVGFPAIIGALVGALMFLPAWPIAAGGAVVGGGLGAASSFLIPGIVVVVVLIALFVQLFKLVFNLITTYIQLLVFTMAGPLFILYGSIPGRGGAISFWFRGLLANALIFPTIFAVFLFAGMLLGNQTEVKASLPLLGGLSGNFIKVLLAFGLILGTPAIPDMIRGLFKVQLAPQLMKEAFSGAGAGVDALKSGYSRATAGPKALKQAREKAEMETKADKFKKSAADGGYTGTWRDAISRLPGT